VDGSRGVDIGIRVDGHETNISTGGNRHSTRYRQGTRNAELLILVGGSNQDRLTRTRAGIWGVDLGVGADVRLGVYGHHVDGTTDIDGDAACCAAANAHRVDIIPVDRGDGEARHRRGGRANAAHADQVRTGRLGQLPVENDTVLGTRAERSQINR